MRSVRERLWAKVDRRPDGECWLWTAAVCHNGYGRIAVAGKSRIAPRVLWEVGHGPIPDGMCVMHSCDNPPCMNPTHLRLGAHRDNMADAKSKGRLKPRSAEKGEAHHFARLTEMDVISMRREANEGRSVRAIARRYGVAPMTASDAIAGRTWGHVW